MHQTRIRRAYYRIFRVANTPDLGIWRVSITDCSPEDRSGSIAALKNLIVGVSSVNLPPSSAKRGSMDCNWSPLPKTISSPRSEL